MGSTIGTNISVVGLTGINKNIAQYQKIATKYSHETWRLHTISRETQKTELVLKNGKFCGQNISQARVLNNQYF